MNKFNISNTSSSDEKQRIKEKQQLDFHKQEKELADTKRQNQLNQKKIAILTEKLSTLQLKLQESQDSEQQALNLIQKYELQLEKAFNLLKNFSCEYRYLAKQDSKENTKFLTGEHKSIGVIYVATGDKYIAEACNSASSLKKQMPDIKITLFTDHNFDNVHFENIIIIPQPHYNYRDKIVYMSQSPYDYTLFLDTDTYICNDFREIFTLLDRFDIAVAYTPQRAGKFKDVPESFQMMNTGVILYRKTPEIIEFFNEWLKLHKNKDPDQPTFREAIYKSLLRLAILTPEYNYRFPFLGCVSGKVKIIHGRHAQLNKVASKINEDNQLRCFGPNDFTFD